MIIHVTDIGTKLIIKNADTNVRIISYYDKDKTYFENVLVHFKRYGVTNFYCHNALKDTDVFELSPLVTTQP